MRIETQRLFIRRFSEQDATDLYDYLSREEVVRFEPHPPLTYEQAVEEATRREEDSSWYAVALKSGKVIGHFHLTQGMYGTWELSFVFHSRYWGQGYAFESMRALLKYAFNSMHARRIVARCNPLNESSWKLLDRVGFRREGTSLQNVFYIKDEEGNPIWQDTYEYAMLKEEWVHISAATGGRILHN